MYIVYISLVSKASDHKYRYLSAFESWVSEATFYPVPNVRVTVELKARGDLLEGGSSCKDCCEKAASSEILDAVASVNWAEINSFDPQKIVSLHGTLRNCYISA